MNPSTNGGGTFDFFNPTGQYITFIQFAVQLPAMLDPTTVENDFGCNDASTSDYPNPFFLFCSVYYAPNNGVLALSFYGLGQGDQGIPPLLPGCLYDPYPPDSTNPDCTGQGHFLITLNDNFDPSGDTGGWADVFGVTNPAITVNGFQTSSEPEPVTALSVTAGLLCLAGWGRLSRRSKPA